MPFPAYLYATPSCVAASNAPNLIDRIVLKGRAAGTVNGKGAIPQLDVQRSSAGCSTVAALRDVTVFRALAVCACAIGQLPRLYGRLAESTPAAVLSNTFTGNSHRIITPLTFAMTLTDTYIESISWSGMLGAGHVAEIRDNRGALILRLVSGLASDGSFANVPVGRMALGGYLVPTLDSGVLLVNVGRQARNIYGRG